MKIHLVKDKKTNALFLKVPRVIYEGDPNWIPHLRQDLEKIFDPNRNKLFRSGEAVRWVLKDNEKLIGRIAAFVNNKTAKSFNQPTGGIGFFECIDDFDAASLLLDTAREWLKEKGMEAMDGPINFGEKNQFWGLMITNFDEPNSYGMNYNPAYYKTLFESYGFKIYYEQFVFHRFVHVPAQEVFIRKYNAIKSDPSYEFGNTRGLSMDEISDRFLTVYNGAWGGHEGFKSMKRAAASKIIKALKPIMDHEIIVFAYHNKIPIGFYINIPELNDIFKYVNGNLNWLGKLIFLYHKMKKTPRRMVGIIFGVVKAYQGKGIDGSMIKWFEDHAVPRVKYNDTILSWIGDFNPRMIKIAENLGGSVHRKYATYRYLFDRSKPFERAPMVNISR